MVGNKSETFQFFELIEISVPAPPPHSGPVFYCKIVTMSVIVIIYNCTILCIDWNLGLCTI